MPMLISINAYTDDDADADVDADCDADADAIDTTFTIYFIATTPPQPIGLLSPHIPFCGKCNESLLPGSFKS